MKSFDIALDETGDLKMNGDFQIAASDAQHIEHILLSSKGDWRHNYFVGAELHKHVASSGTPATLDEARRSIRIALEFDDYEVLGLDLNSLDDIQINAEKKG